MKILLRFGKAVQLKKTGPFYPARAPSSEYQNETPSKAGLEVRGKLEVLSILYRQHRCWRWSPTSLATVSRVFFGGAKAQSSEKFGCEFMKL